MGRMWMRRLGAALALGVAAACAGDATGVQVTGNGGQQNPQSVATVRGTVLVGGTGLSGAAVAIAGNSTGASSPGSATTDGNGQFRFENLRPGTYTVTLTVPAGFTLAPGEASQRTITLFAGESAQFSFTLQRQNGGG